MDRLFLYQTEYINDRHNPDGPLILHTFDTCCNMNLDRYEPCSLDTAGNKEKLNALYENARERKLRIVPVGDLEYVRFFLAVETGSPVMRPLEIPETLILFVKRPYRVVYGRDMSGLDFDPNVTFVKDADHLKKFNSLLCLTDRQVREHIEPDTRYVVSENVGFSSEWRIFVLHDNIIGSECYLGNPGVFPDTGTIHSMLNAYKNEARPEAYVLDVGIRLIERFRFEPSRQNVQPLTPVSLHAVTEPIEVHPFVSCGLYGFCDRDLLDCFDKGYQWYLTQNGKQVTG